MAAGLVPGRRSAASVRRLHWSRRDAAYRCNMQACE